MNFASILLGLSLAFLSACGVSHEVHQKALADLEVAQTELAEAQKPKTEGAADPDETIRALEDKIARLEAQKSELEEDLILAKAGFSVTPDGIREPTDVSGHIRLDVEKFKKCFPAQRSTFGSFQGDVVFTILMTGRVEDVGIRDSTLGDSATESCLVKTYQEIAFPEASAEVNVRQTVVFERKPINQ